ncbi:MAG: 5'/3'-nucleotidase SurE [Deltaproteobacteria bacterium]|nr:5'/3'-nucleotidase SurE [Deltaproteobacteria bacterium]
MNILLTNDDGLAADGLQVAYKALVAQGHQVTACAPDRERSAHSQSVTIGQPLGAQATTMPDGAIGYAISGTPADCSRLGFTTLAPPPLDLVISGVNNDSNLGYDANYSGTVAAALEAAGQGLSALAVSVERSDHYDWATVAEIVVEAVQRFPGWEIPKGVMVNLNIPAIISDPRWVWTAINPTPAPDSYLKLQAYEKGCSQYTRLRQEENCPATDDSDLALFRAGRITLSPIVPVATYQPALKRLRNAHQDDNTSGTLRSQKSL